MISVFSDSKTETLAGNDNVGHVSYGRSCVKFRHKKKDCFWKDVLMLGFCKFSRRAPNFIVSGWKQNVLTLKYKSVFL